MVSEENITGEIIANFLEPLAEKLGQETDAVCFADWVHYPPKPTPDYTGDGFAWLVQRDAAADGKNRLTFFCIGPNARCYIAQGDFQPMQTDPRYLENIFPAVMRQVAGATTQPCHRLAMISPDNIGQIQRDYVLQLPTEAKSVIAMSPKLRRQLLSEIIISHLDRRIAESAPPTKLPYEMRHNDDGVLLYIGSLPGETKSEPCAMHTEGQIEKFDQAVFLCLGGDGQIGFYHEIFYREQYVTVPVNDRIKNTAFWDPFPIDPKTGQGLLEIILPPSQAQTLRSLVNQSPAARQNFVARILMERKR